MMKAIPILLLSAASVGLAACTLPSSHPETGSVFRSKPITLSLARKIIPETATRSDVEQLVGASSSVIKPNEKNLEIWIYRLKDNSEVPRMYVFIASDSGIVKSVTWNVFKEDPESKLDFAKDELGTLDLKKTEPKWTKGDTAPDEVYFSDEKTGVTIVVRKTLNQVSSIMWN